MWYIGAGLSKGVGFVRFDLRTEADIAISQFNGKVPPGGTEPMVIKFANHPSSNPTPPPFHFPPVLPPVYAGAGGVGPGMGGNGGLHHSVGGGGPPSGRYR